MQKETEDKQRCKSIKHSENNSIEMAYTNNSQTCRIINPKHVQLHKSTKSFPHTVYSANAHHGRKIKAFNRHTHTHTHTQAGEVNLKFDSVKGYFPQPLSSFSAQFFWVSLEFRVRAV